MDANPQIKPTALLYDSADRLLPSTSTIAIYYYYSPRKLILILPSIRKVTPFWILMKQKTMQWRWHQPDRMQIICTLFQTDNHDSPS